MSSVDVFETSIRINSMCMLKLWLKT